jgi:hypothetical protein
MTLNLNIPQTQIVPARQIKGYMECCEIVWLKPMNFMKKLIPLIDIGL